MWNQFKTILFLGLLTALLIWVGSFWGITGLTIAIVIVLGMNLVMYFFSDKIVLAMYRAKEIKDKESKPYKIIEHVAKLANIPTPKSYIINTTTPNAFATGRSPKHAAVAVTSGILNLLNEKELEGVIAHEISHIKNRDILIATVAATIAGIIAYAAQIAQFGLIFGSGRDDRGSGNVIGLLILAIVVPIAAMLIQLAISRAREYIADRSGALLIRNPHALADALESLEDGVKAHPLQHGNPATASLFILNPFSGRSILNLFSTHPPIKERVNRLRAMKI